MPQRSCCSNNAPTKLMRGDYVAVCMYQFLPLIPDKNKHVMSDQKYNHPHNTCLAFLPCGGVSNWRRSKELGYWSHVDLRATSAVVTDSTKRSVVTAIIRLVGHEIIILVRYEMGNSYKHTAHVFTSHKLGRCVFQTAMASFKQQTCCDI